MIAHNSFLTPSLLSPVLMAAVWSQPASDTIPGPLGC